MNIIIVPYTMFGGGEVYLINTYVHHFIKEKVLFLIREGNNKFINRIEGKYKYNIFKDNNDLLNKLLSYNLDYYDITYYNSKNIYLTINELRKYKKVFLREIIHSELIYPDSNITINNRIIDETIVVSETVAKNLRLKKFKIIRPTIDENRFKNYPKNKDKNNIVIGMVCRLSQEKNIPRAINILSYLPEKYKLKIVGHDCGDKGRILNYIKRLNLENRVEIKDYTEEIEREYATFDIFMLTSLVEGFPITILEAIASGLPVIAPDIGGIREIKDVILFQNDEDDKNIAKRIINIKINKEDSQNISLTNNRDLDFLFIGGCDRNTNFHNLDVMARILSLKNYKSIIIDVNYNNLPNTYDIIFKYLKQAKNLIIYRFTPVREDIYKYCKENNIKIGFTIDDNLFNTTNKKIPIVYQNFIRNDITKADYCFAYNTIQLANEIRNINPNTYFIENVHMYDFIYKSLGIIDPIKNTTDIIRIGINYGFAHMGILENVINFLKNSLNKLKDKKFEIIFFFNKVINTTYGNVNIKSILYEKDIISYYNRLHSLGLDVIYVEYTQNLDMIKTKSNLKWREASYIGVPLIAVTPFNIYNITNYSNGFYYFDRNKFIDDINVIMNKELLLKCGDNARQQFLSIKPEQTIEKFLGMVKKENKK